MIFFQDPVQDRYFYNGDTGDRYPLDEADILADGITAIDITAAPVVSSGESLPVLPTCGGKYFHTSGVFTSHLMHCAQLCSKIFQI